MFEQALNEHIEVHEKSAFRDKYREMQHMTLRGFIFIFVNIIDYSEFDDDNMF